MASFKNGDIVVVKRQTRYRSIPVGAVGTVYNANPMYENSIAVKLDCFHNGRSGYDCFYFKSTEIELYKGEVKIMEGRYIIATVKFLDETGDRTYRYALYPDLIGSILVGDICVVKSAHHGMGLATIVELGPKTDEKITREVVCKCDFDAYNAREAIRKRRAELKTKMAKRAAALQELALYKMMAAEDSSMADLMAEFDELEEC